MTPMPDPIIRNAVYNAVVMYPMDNKFRLPNTPEFGPVRQELMRLRAIQYTGKIQSLFCCAFKELANLSTRREMSGFHEYVDSICLKVPPETCAKIFFTQAESPTMPLTFRYGDEFRRFIETEQLGTTAVNQTVLNPNSGKNVTLYEWIPSAGSLKNRFLKRYPVTGATMYGKGYDLSTAGF